MTITSPHNDRLKEIRKLARRRAREQTGRFVAEGEDLLAAADAAGWPARRALLRGGQRARRRRGRAGAAGARLAARLGHARARRLRAALGAAPAGPLCVALHGHRRPRQRRHDPALARSRSAPRPSRSGPAAPTRTGRRRCARRWARCSRSRSRACAARRASCRARTVALDAHAGEPLAGRGGREVRTLLVGAERDGPAEDVVAACDRSRTSRSASESLNAAMAATVALYE